MAGEASGPETFTLPLRLLVTHSDRVDNGGGFTKLHIFSICNGTPFADFSRSFAYLCRPLRGVSVFRLRGRMWCWRWFGRG